MRISLIDRLLSCFTPPLDMSLPVDAFGDTRQDASPAAPRLPPSDVGPASLDWLRRHVAPFRDAEAGAGVTRGSIELANAALEQARREGRAVQ